LRQGFDSSLEILEGSLGFTRIYSATQQNGAITAGLGYQWEREQAARRRDQEDLSAKMKQIGRRIDSAERTLRR
jgi:hypothetical protein